MKNLKKLAITSLSLITLGAITPIVINSSKHNITLNSSRTSNNVLKDGTSLGPYLHVDSGESNSVTSLQLDDHFNAVSDKLQLSLMAAGCDEDTIASTVGMFKANIASHQQKTAFKSDSDLINSTYSYINKQAALFGIDVPDYDSMYNVAAGRTGSCASLVQQTIVNDQYKMADFSTIQRDLILAQGGSENDLLHCVLEQADTSINDSLNVVNDGSFINKLSAYNSNGKYKTGDVLSQADLSSLFTMKYSTVQGFDYSSIYDQLQNYDATESGEYDQGVLDSLVQNQAMTGFNGAYATFEPGEFLPGFQLKSKILNEDYSTDSSKCKITFQFGIASSNDPSNIIWSDINNENQNGVTNFSFDILSLENKKYCAKTNFYNESIAPKIDVTNLEKTVNASGDIYLPSSYANRTLIENILSKYQGPKDKDYDLKNYPIITTDEKDWKGLPQAQVQGIKDMASDYLHTNQSLALVISDVNDNVTISDPYSLCLKMGWAIVDNDPATNSLKPVYNIDFVDTNALSNPDIPQDPTITDSIWVKFDMNKEDKETIEEASNIVLLTTSVSATDETYSKDVYADEHAEKQEKYIDIAGGMALGATLLAAACDVMAGIELAMAFSGAPELIGESLAMSATAVLTSAAAVAAEVMVIKIGKSIEQGKKVKGEFEKADLNKPYLDWLKQINQYADIVLDGSAQLQGKIDASKEVIKLWNENEQYRESIANIIANCRAYNDASDGKTTKESKFKEWWNKVKNDKMLDDYFVADCVVCSFGIVASIVNFAILASRTFEMSWAWNLYSTSRDAFAALPSDEERARVINLAQIPNERILAARRQLGAACDTQAMWRDTIEAANGIKFMSAAGILISIFSMALSTAAEVYADEAK